MTLADMVTYVLVYFITSGVILATLDSWLLLPRLNRYIREQALQRIAAQREASLADGVLDHDRLQQLDAAEAHIHQAGITPKLLFGLLLGFDLLALQLPYLLH